MCYICKCFGWALDFVQRVLTFALACIMFCAICIGITVAVVAGIAYGYNYMLAEFLTLGRTDLAVYVRRGQFHDKPDFGKGLMRRKGDEDDLFASNASDYQDLKVRSDSKPLSDTWRKALDTRKYAEKLTKYSRGQFGEFFNTSLGHKAVGPQPVVPTKTTPDLSVVRRIYSVTPNLGMPTTINPTRTDIVMRNFEPVDQMPVSLNTLDSEFYEDNEHTTTHPRKHNKGRKEKQPDIKISLKEKAKSSKYVPMKYFSKDKTLTDYPGEEVDEEAIVYKPV